MSAGLQERVLSNLDTALNTFNAGELAFFDQFAKEATIFTVDSPEPIRGREAYRAMHQASFVGQRREKTILDRDVQVVGDKAVVTLTAQIKHDEAVAKVRQTIIYGDTPTEGLKVVHMHTALLTDANSTTPDVGIVHDEVISTIPPVVGVAQ
jgi:ketosteroid isomerase-like protein